MTPRRRLLRRVRRLASREGRRVVLAVYWLVWTDLSLRLLGFERTRDRYSRLGRHLPEPRSATEWHAWANERAYTIARAAHITPTRAVCLQQSLVLYCWLRRQGEPCELRIGVRKAGAAIAAHAWVELDGQVVNDTPGVVGAFAVLTSAPGAAHAGAALPIGSFR